MTKNIDTKIELDDAIRIATKGVKDSVNNERKEFCKDLGFLIDGVKGLFNIHWFADNQCEEMIIDLIKTLQEKYKNEIIDKD